MFEYWGFIKTCVQYEVISSMLLTCSLGNRMWYDGKMRHRLLQIVLKWIW